MECVVHIGDIKSGTTSVQAALAADNIPSVGKKVIYPCREFNHNNLAHLFRIGDARNKQFVIDIRKAIKEKQNADVFIISGELLSTLDPNVVKMGLSSSFGDLASKFTVLHYIRPHFGRAFSAYAEQTKIGSTSQSLGEFIHRSIGSGRFKHNSKIDSWRNAFGENYIVRPMQRDALYQEDVVADFFLTGLGEISENWNAPPQMNEALSDEGLIHVRRLQEALKGRSKVLRHSLGYEFERKFAAVDRKSGILEKIDQGVAGEFFDAYKEDAKKADAHLRRPILEEALNRGMQEKIKRDHNKILLQHTEQANKIILRLLDIATHVDEREYSIRLRRERFKRYIEKAKPLPIAPK